MPDYFPEGNQPLQSDTPIRSLQKINSLVLNAAGGGTVGSSLLYGNGSGGFSNADVSSPLSFSGGILSLPTQAGSNLIYVSKSSAATDDRTGLSKYDFFRPFATVTAALSAATSAVVGLPHIDRITAIADINGSLNSTGFLLHNSSGSVGVWYNNGSGSQPNLGADVYVEIGYNTDDDAATIASETIQPLIDSLQFQASVFSGAQFDVTNYSSGPQTAASDGDTGFGFSVHQAGTTPTSGDNLVINTGIYNEHGIVKTGVEQLWMPGARVILTGGITEGIFDDGGNDIACNIFGYGEFFNETEGVLGSGVVNITGASTVNITCSVMEASGPRAVDQGVITVDNAAAVVEVNCNSISGLNGYAGVAGKNGNLTVTCPYIYSETDIAVSALTGDAQSNLKVDAITITGRTAINSVRTNSGARLFVTCIEAIASGISADTCIYNGGGKVYVNAEKLSSTVGDASYGVLWWGTAGGSLGSETWVTAQKLTVPSLSNALGLASSGSETALTKAWINIAEVELLGTCGSIFQANNQYDTSEVSLGSVVGAAASGGISIIAGVVKLKNTSISTVANSSTNPITKSGGTLVLDDVTLLAEATRAPIAASTSQNVIVKSAYSNSLIVDADVTEQVGTIVRNALVQ